MALRLSENHASPGEMGVGANMHNQRVVSHAVDMGVVGVGAFEDDQTPFIEETPLAGTYNGPAGLSEIEFLAFPGLKGTIANALKGASSFQSDLLRLEVWQDTNPGGFTGLFLDKYRVRSWTRGDIEPGQGEAGASEILNAASTSGVSGNTGVGNTGVGVLPILAGITFLFLLKLIVIIGAAVIVGVLVWKASRVSWGDVAGGIASRPLILLGIIGIGAGLLLFNKRR